MSDGDEKFSCSSIYVCACILLEYYILKESLQSFDISSILFLTWGEDTK